MLHAVVVGINKYQDPRIKDLFFARSDAEAFYRLLENINAKERHIQLILDENATKRDLSIAIGEELPRISKPEDVIILYFAGHGTPEINSGVDDISRYLVPYDADHRNIFSTAIDMELELYRWFERLKKPKLVIVFLDACFSGRAGGRSFRGLRFRKATAHLHTRGNISLKDLDLGEGRLIITACDENQVARENPLLQHGIFTYFLIRSLKNPVLNSKSISINKLYDDVATEVKNYTYARQVPILNGRSKLAHLPLFTNNSP